MKELKSCQGPVSGEHLITECVIRVLIADAEFSISGVPWLKAGESKVLAPHSVRANCLCAKHNSALHPLDDAAKYFFSSLKDFLEIEPGLKHALISGHDLVRWSRFIGQLVKLGSPMKDGPDDGQAEAVFG